MNSATSLRVHGPSDLLRACARTPHGSRSILQRHSEGRHTLRRCNAVPATEDEGRFGWGTNERQASSGVIEVPLKSIRRPLQRTRTNNQEKVEALVKSISVRGLLVPIDVLEVDGKYYGFSGCHRFEAFQRLEKDTIPCRVRKANQQTLRMHLM